MFVSIEYIEFLAGYRTACGKEERCVGVNYASALLLVCLSYEEGAFERAPFDHVF